MNVVRCYKTQKEKYIQQSFRWSQEKLLPVEWPHKAVTRDTLKQCSTLFLWTTSRVKTTSGLCSPATGCCCGFLCTSLQFTSTACSLYYCLQVQCWLHLNTAQLCFIFSFWLILFSNEFISMFGNFLWYVRKGFCGPSWCKEWTGLLNGTIILLRNLEHIAHWCSNTSYSFIHNTNTSNY